MTKKLITLARELNPQPLALEVRIIPRDQTLNLYIKILVFNNKYIPKKKR